MLFWRKRDFKLKQWLLVVTNGKSFSSEYLIYEDDTDIKMQYSISSM